MEEAKLYDTSAVIKLIAKEKVKEIPGYISIYTVVEYPPVLFINTKILYPLKEDYYTAIKWQTDLRKLGKPLPAIDLIIAAMGYNKGYEIVTLDDHFNYIKLVAKDIKIRLMK